MWEKSKQSISSGDDSTNVIAGGDVNFYLPGSVPTDLVDQYAEEEIWTIRKSRFFREFDKAGPTLRLARRLTEGDLSAGSDEVRGRALAWCARLLSPSGDLDSADRLLKFAKTLGDTPESTIADAFITSRRGDKAAALSTLAGIDSSASHSAGLLIASHHDGADGALSWVADAGYTAADLDSDGKTILLSHQLQLGRWDDIAGTVESLSGTDFDESPSLHHLAAIATLAPTVPKDFRTAILTQVPFEARGFPLASDTVAMDARRAAHKYFLNAAEAAKQLACPRAAKIADEYALWLELRDPAQATHGKHRLETKLRDPDSALGVVHFALQFDVRLDLDAVERAIDRQIAKNGGMTVDAAIARFALAFTRSTPEEIANYLARHHAQLAAHIDPEMMQFRQIEMYSRAGLIEQASEILEELLGKGISAEEEKTLRRVISEGQGNDPVESRKSQYKATGALEDLISLVTGLEEHQRWAALCDFGERLFKETRSLQDAERLVRALENTHKSDALIQFFDENADLLSQSNHLRMSYAWGLYNEGAFLKSRAVLAELSDEAETPNFRALKLNLGIAMGDWASLISYIAEVYQNKDVRSAEDLLKAAQLALHLGSPHAKELVFAATAKANDNAAILVTAYSIATSAGWEDESRVFKWLEKAAELSGDDGPLQKVSLKDILDRKPEWDLREAETWRLLARGQIPLFLGAQSLNRSLIDFTAFQALANLSATDPRQRSPIPAYSGKRVQQSFAVDEKAVALDATAILTLSFLDILEKTLDAFALVYIPHSTLGWLFDERRKAAFHQPSRIAKARHLRDLLATDALVEFAPTTVASSDLTGQVGEELAALIAEAEKEQENDDAQPFVVRSAPVHRVSSLMEEEADLSPHADVLSGCVAVVEKLRQEGQITADEEKRARAYLQLHETAWPNQPEIGDGATLYLDNLAISYLMHVGMLGKLKAAGLTAVASPRAVSEADALISYERISEKVEDVIEHIRASLSSRIESDQVRVGRRHGFEDLEEPSLPEHPSVGILALASHCDVAIVDDRFLNQHANIDAGSARAPVFSTLSLLDALVAAGVLTDEERLEHRTRLRRAGYLFIAVTADELERCLRETAIVDGKVIETAELKAIRESVLRARMSDWLQLPEEYPWLGETLSAFVRVLKKLWEDGVDIEEITVRSNWLVKQFDIRGWAHRFAPQIADNVVRSGRASHILVLLIPPTGVQRGVEEAYWNWVEGEVLAPIQEQFPEVYEWLVDWHRSHIAQTAENPILEGEIS